MKYIFSVFCFLTLVACQPHKEVNTINIKKESQAINTLVNNWHHAATVADEDTFFGSMTPDAIYIGTDASERWSRDEMKVWAKDIFKRDTAWAFTPLSRHIDFAQDGQTAWFDELLMTWMDTCRSSGVVLKDNGEWKIKHYHLSMAIPNKHVKAYLDLIGKK